MDATIPARAVPLIGTALIVGLGYYLGVQVGLALRFPPATTSVLWPPNAILTAALLLTPTKRWWACFAGALPVHFLLQSTVGWSPTLVGALFLTNCSEALIAVAFMRAFDAVPVRFDTLRGVVVFMAGAGVVGPVLSSFADAAAVQAFQGDPFSDVMRTRVVANALTELSVVPPIVLLVTHSPSLLKIVPGKRALEAAVLGFVLIAVAGLTFGGGAVDFDLPPTPTVLVLPLFFWAALRFGAGGMSTALLVTALIASFAARAGNRPFSVLDAADGLRALQMYLIVMSAPLFALSALMQERRSAMAELAQGLRFEELLSDLSRSFVRSPRDRISAAFDASLRRAGAFFHVDSVAIMQVSRNRTNLVMFRQWAACGEGPGLPDSHSSEVFPWASGRLLAGEEVVCASVDDLPRDAARDRASFIELGLRSAVGVPLVSSGVVQGAIAFQMTTAARAWPDPLVGQLRMVAGVFANALGRERVDDALRSSESMKTAILASLSSCLAVLDREGAIIAVNDRWRDRAKHAASTFSAASVGDDYLAMCRRAAESGDHSAAEALDGVQSVLAGRAPSYTLEYRDSREDERWYAMTVTPLQRAAGGAVVGHEDVTKRKQAELEAQRARQDLGHFTRVSTMGELTASLAHQLNQPLAGIMSNAQTARRILEDGPPDLIELRAIVHDIVEDDRRAGEVIRRMRELMTKGNSKLVITDANAVVRDVAALITSDAIIRNVALTLELHPAPLPVRGDSIELQQVILNLLVNGIDAVAGRPVPERTIRVCSEHTRGGSALLSVADSGPGLPSGAEANIFEPFFTTKPTGMGMGLAIARSIVDSHEGRIWAESRAQGGATFFVQLPLARGDA